MMSSLEATIRDTVEKAVNESQHEMMMSQQMSQPPPPMYPFPYGYPPWPMPGYGDNESDEEDMEGCEPLPKSPPPTSSAMSAILKTYEGTRKKADNDPTTDDLSPELADLLAD